MEIAELVFVRPSIEFPVYRFMMSESSGSSVSVSQYGVVGQPLTRDYLAKQLPMFQHKVPKSTRVRVYKINVAYLRLLAGS